MIPFRLTMLAATVALATLSTATASPTRVVVLPFENGTGEESLYWMGEAFAIGITDHLLAAGVDVVEPARRREAMREMELASERSLTLASSLLIARRVNADAVVSGNVVLEAGHQIRISSRLFRTADSQTEPPVVLRGDLENLHQLQKRCAGALLPVRGGPTDHAQVPPLQMLDDVPLSSFELLAKAMTTESREERESFLDGALAADPSYPAALIERARLYLDDGRPREALLWLDRVVEETMPFPERYWLLLGDTVAANGDRGSALDLYHRVLTRRQLPLAHFRLAAVLAQQGKILEARQQVDAGLVLDPQNPLGIELREALAHREAVAHRSEPTS